MRLSGATMRGDPPKKRGAATLHAAQASRTMDSAGLANVCCEHGSVATNR